MTPVFQTEFFHTHNRGNCFQAVIASLLDIPLEEAIPIHLYYSLENWTVPLQEWLAKRGLYWKDSIEFSCFHPEKILKHRFEPVFIEEEKERLKDKFYLVSGPSPRDPSKHHVVIYKAGAMVHDPHPDNTGVLSIEYLESFEPLINS